ncbi:MAG: hypothetical protein ACAI44_20120 [Candidatus Sericytochromatia bacterium]
MKATRLVLLILGSFCLAMPAWAQGKEYLKVIGDFFAADEIMVSKLSGYQMSAAELLWILPGRRPELHLAYSKTASGQSPASRFSLIFGRPVFQSLQPCSKGKPFKVSHPQLRIEGCAETVSLPVAGKTIQVLNADATAVSANGRVSCWLEAHQMSGQEVKSLLEGLAPLK